MDFCHKRITSTSKFADVANHRCWKPEGHEGPCDEYPYLRHLRRAAPKVAEKIKRDATNTTGASWGSDEAGPNRLLRWAALLTVDELLAYGRDLSGLSEVVRRKLREKGAPYEECMGVAQALTHAVYRMTGAPEPPEDVRAYLEELLGPIEANSANCLICLEQLGFELFELARRGAAELDTAHSDPRLHTAGNVGFAHHRCNVAQGDRTIEEFYTWAEAMLRRAGRIA